MSKKSSAMGNDVHSAMISSDIALFLETVFFGKDADISGTLKKGEAAYGGIKADVITIIDPDYPAHFVVCKNILTYSAIGDNPGSIFMNASDFNYFINLGFEAGDEVFVVAGDISSKLKVFSSLISE